MLLPENVAINLLPVTIYTVRMIALLQIGTPTLVICKRAGTAFKMVEALQSVRVTCKFHSLQQCELTKQTELAKSSVHAVKCGVCYQGIPWSSCDGGVPKQGNMPTIHPLSPFPHPKDVSPVMFLHCLNPRTHHHYNEITRVQKIDLIFLTRPSFDKFQEFTILTQSFMVSWKLPWECEGKFPIDTIQPHLCQITPPGPLNHQSKWHPPPEPISTAFRPLLPVRWWSMPK